MTPARDRRNRLFGAAASLAALFPLLVAATPVRAVDDLPPEIRASLERLSADRLWEDAARLAADDLCGRGTGDPGGDAAADFLAGKMAEAGLLPAGEGGTYFQPVPMHGGRPLPDGRLEIHLPDTTLSLAVGGDFLLYTTGAATIVPEPAPLVFAGYGIVAPEYDYNDYQNVQAEGAIVVMLSGEPPSNDPDYFAGEAPTLHSHPEWKQRTAIARGARGTILIPVAREGGGEPWADRRRDFSFEHVTLLQDVPRGLDVLLRPENAPLLFRHAWYSWEEIREMDRASAIRSFPLHVEASFRSDFRERDFVARNVIGRIEGRDPLLKDSHVLLSAHYDHLGVGPPLDGDSIYNGMVDNALGCAALLEIARVLGESERPPLRSVVFLLVTGEEKGLLGSRHYCAHPAVPLSSTIAAINVDGLAITDTFDDVVGIGAGLSTLGAHLRRAADRLGLAVSPIPPFFLAGEAFTRSDQLAFALAGVPSILVMEGTRYRNLGPERGTARFLTWGFTRYHTPFDDADQPIHRPAMLLHCGIVLALAGELANTYTPPQWLPGSEYVTARLRTLAERR